MIRRTWYSFLVVDCCGPCWGTVSCPLKTKNHKNRWEKINPSTLRDNSNCHTCHLRLPRNKNCVCVCVEVSFCSLLPNENQHVSRKKCWKTILSFWNGPISRRIMIIVDFFWAVVWASNRFATFAKDVKCLAKVLRVVAPGDRIWKNRPFFPEGVVVKLGCLWYSEWLLVILWYFIPTPKITSLWIVKFEILRDV